MDYSEEEKFKELLNNEYDWPARYTFKFIVPSGKEQKVKELFKKEIEISEKSSSGGKYISTTIYTTMDSADDIITVYKQASEISGIISL